MLPAARALQPHLTHSGALSNERAAVDERPAPYADLQGEPGRCFDTITVTITVTITAMKHLLLACQLNIVLRCPDEIPGQHRPSTCSNLTAFIAIACVPIACVPITFIAIAFIEEKRPL